ncbi:hypothetical protein Tco_0018573 [Tanacetum coccineum]
MSSSTKRNVVVAGLDDTEPTQNKKLFQQPKQKDLVLKEENPAKVTKDKQHVVNDDKLDEWYYEMEAEEQK